MVYLASAACLGWVVTSCLLVYLLKLVLDRQQEERAAHRIEIDVQRQEIAEAAKSHREEIAALHQARVEEVANLLQRIQAPEAAVAQHAGNNAAPDQPPLDLDDDMALMDEAARNLYMFQTELEGAQ